jgi:hypothetical protein
MNNVPQTLVTEAVDALNSLIKESDRFRDWNAPEIQILVRKLEKLQKVDAREAFVRLGALAAICGNVDDVFAYLNKALLLPGELETRPEFWVSLGNAALYGKAHAIGSWLLEPRRGFFPKIWQRAVNMGHVAEVWDRLSDAKKTFPELSQVDFSIVESAAAVMRANGLSDQNIESVLDVMGEVQRAHRIMFAGQGGARLRVMCPPDDPAYLYFAIPIDAGVEEIHGMNRELARLVVEELPDGVFPQGMVATFAKTDPLALRAAA